MNVNCAFYTFWSRVEWVKNQIDVKYDENLRTGFMDMNIVGLDLNAHSLSSLPQEDETAGDVQ